MKDVPISKEQLRAVIRGRKITAKSFVCFAMITGQTDCSSGYLTVMTSAEFKQIVTNAAASSTRRKLNEKVK